jgi:hypothetical protein
MLVNKQKATISHILSPLVYPIIPLNLFFLNVSGPALESAVIINIM